MKDADFGAKLSPFIGKDGEPMTWDQVETRVVDREYKIIAQEEVTTPDEFTVFVSTVWSGLDILTDGADRPLIFETAVFESRALVYKLHMVPAATEREAYENHQIIVRRLAAGQSLHDPL